MHGGVRGRKSAEKEGAEGRIIAPESQGLEAVPDAAATICTYVAWTRPVWPVNDRPSSRLDVIMEQSVAIRLTALVAALALMSCTESTSSSAEPSPETPAAETESAADNEELAAMFAADQAARTGGMISNGVLVTMQDAERRVRTRAMLDASQINTAQDYFHAAFIFQHGNEPDDFLLAHALAVTAVSKGHARAPWIAAATLDRYLQNIGRSQIYGTQYRFPSGGGEVTQGEYDRELLPDALRVAAGVPTLEGQEDQRRHMQEQFDQSSTGD
ncbi:hypothetical protein [Brevundimonas sp.]|uniref:hypothetical protein n=1 Tax=Brevundimonas sp. TaxID=1871086 RepID=UPI0025C071ED|nr:hypothetical protein [Brevundimonas sp.]